MLKPTISTTTAATVEVRLSATLQAKALARCEEVNRLKDEIKKREARIEDCKAELDGMFEDAGEYGALVSGVDINGYPVKLVTGTTTRLNEMDLMRTHGLTAADLDACRETKPSKPYIKVGAKKGRAE